eukprot:2945730-Prymnesium_polylepis.1
MAVHFMAPGVTQRAVPLRRHGLCAHKMPSNMDTVTKSICQVRARACPALPLPPYAKCPSPEGEPRRHDIPAPRRTDHVLYFGPPIPSAYSLEKVLAMVANRPPVDGAPCGWACLGMHVDDGIGL